ncbi:hypothetical protein ACFPFP_14540 [Bradyrhizobium sp. GCM10023182]|uniref:Uncharacterized protein n=1 Tax=Bradyrhizobium zhengyangense TaxID=2911009 RepID=A0ABS9LME8_9BRAD|nr:hypothetical protein [Bradyrhizobium zhengyangense]MCG2668169.1 hypothetical protein [Bradyrhizobium zhengyangense]
MKLIIDRAGACGMAATIGGLDANAAPPPNPPKPWADAGPTAVSEPTAMKMVVASNIERRDMIGSYFDRM